MQILPNMVLPKLIYFAYFYLSSIFYVRVWSPLFQMGDLSTALDSFRIQAVEEEELDVDGRGRH
jgi:hypothetical protein